MSERLFKVLNVDGTCYHGGTGQWSLPHDGQPGDWMPVIEGDLEACANGYHLCRESDLIFWLGPAIYEAEYRGDRIDSDNKVVVRQARLLRRLDAWTEQTARLFACDCAESVLKLYERQHPQDNSPRYAIEIARRYARGNASAEELSASCAAAWDAWDAAWDANAAAWDASAAAYTAANAAASDKLTIYLMRYLYPEEC